jgi:hypothetical protein
MYKPIFQVGNTTELATMLLAIEHWDDTPRNGVSVNE